MVMIASECDLSKFGFIFFLLPKISLKIIINFRKVVHLNLFRFKKFHLKIFLKVFSELVSANIFSSSVSNSICQNSLLQYFFFNRISVKIYEIFYSYKLLRLYLFLQNKIIQKFYFLIK